MFSYSLPGARFFRVSDFAGALVLLVTPGVIPAQTASPAIMHIDASQTAPSPVAANYRPGSSASPGGHTLGLNSRYLTRDGKPWLPVMGEFHFSRYPRAQWEEELLKMKAAGVNIVATYVIWIHHEEIEGQFDWTGERDLRAFAELCAKNGLLLEPRLGPWAHAEARNGGLPDWVLKRGPTRVNDPVYLAEAGRWYDEIGHQLHGLMWKDGGPVVAIQLENEYSARGSGAGEEHILALKKLALQAGLDVPYYFVTAWDNAVVPEPEVLPVFGGGYPDAPWDRSITKLSPPEVYAFRFQSRVSANMEWMGASGTQNVHSTPADHVPYLTAEIGGGTQDTYHRRPVIHPDDIGAMFPVMLGSGVNLYGTYMFHGGENPEGKLTTLEESQATGYPNDLPIRSYDFQAPLGAYGQERASLGKMKVYQYFLNEFGAMLAPMAVHAPDDRPKGPSDLTVPRVSVRATGDSGFLFCNNYVRNYSMPERPAVQFDVRLPGGDLRIPQSPIAIPSGAYFIWPFHVNLGGVELRYSTAQLMTQLENDGVPTYYFAAVKGIAPEFAFASTALEVRASGGIVNGKDGVTYVRGLKPGVDSWIKMKTKDGTRTRLVVLSADEAEHAWRVRMGGKERLLITSADLGIDADGGVRLRSRGKNHFTFTVSPAPVNTPEANFPVTVEARSADGVRYRAEVPECALEASVTVIQPAGDAPEVRLGPADEKSRRVAEAPSDAELPTAESWAISIPAFAGTGLSDVFLDIHYTGDVARLYSDGKLLDDDFFNGLDWSVGLGRFFDPKRPGTLKLSILPLRMDAPVYFETPDKIPFDAKGQAVRVESVRLVPEYELLLSPATRSNHAQEGSQTGRRSRRTPAQSTTRQTIARFR